MRSLTKKLTIILVVALLLVTMVALVACGNKDDNGEVLPTEGKFTVQVLLPDGTPIQTSSGLIVQLCAIKDGNEEGCLAYNVNNKGAVCETGELKDIDGNVTYAPTVCNIHLQRVPAQYKVPEDMLHAQVEIGKLVVIRLENA